MAGIPNTCPRWAKGSQSDEITFNATAIQVASCLLRMSALQSLLVEFMEQ